MCLCCVSAALRRRTQDVYWDPEVGVEYPDTAADGGGGGLGTAAVVALVVVGALAVVGAAVQYGRCGGKQESELRLTQLRR